MQTSTVESSGASDILLSRHIAKDLDYLAARLHARRSRMAEAERLDSLSHIKNLAEFFQAVFPSHEIKETADFQRLSVNELISELSSFHRYLSGAGSNLIDWMVVRFQTENLKLLIRAYLTKTSFEELEIHLVPLPKKFAFDVKKLAVSESLEEFTRLLPKGPHRDSLEKALKIHFDSQRPFYFEASLDSGYFDGLLERTGKLSHQDLELIKPIITQEIDIFHLMLVARGKFHYGLAQEMLLPLHINGTRITKALFSDMLNDPDLYSAVSRVADRVLDAALPANAPDDSMSIDASDLEGFAWKRFYRLANMAFRQNHMGLGAIIGYAALRRMEVANLITISEGIRSNTAAETIREQLIPRTSTEVTYV